MTQPLPEPGEAGSGIWEQPGLPGYAVPVNQPYRPLAGYGAPHQPYPVAGYQPRLGKDPRLAEWWQRLLARLIDGVVLFVLAIVVLLPIHFSFLHQFSVLFHDMLKVHQNAGQRGAIPVQPAPVVPTGRVLAADLIGVVIAFAYDWLQHGLWGQTLGKRALGTIVVMADTGSKIGGRVAGVRAAVYTLPTPVPYVGGLFSLLNVIWLLWDKRRQCLHDKAGRTVVVKKAALTRQAATSAGYLNYPPGGPGPASPASPEGTVPGTGSPGSRRA